MTERAGLLTQRSPAGSVWNALWARIVALSHSRRAGFALLGVSLTAFLTLAVLALFFEPVLLRVDMPVQLEVIGARTGVLDHLMEWVSLLGTRYVIGTILAGLAGWVLVTGRCRKALGVLIIAFFADFALEIVLKQGIGRPRPDILRLVPGRGPSFPSGHVLATVGFYGLLAVVAWKSTKRALARSTAYLAATAVILTVGISRMYLGVHWFSDVMAGMLVGTAFVLIAGRFLRGHHLSAARSCCAPAAA